MRLLDLLQVVDSSFPSGSYAHSAGLEGRYALGDVELMAHVRFALDNSLARVELPIVRRARGGADLASLDVLMDLLLPVKELRDASRSIGRSVRRALAALDALDGEAAHRAIGAEHHAVVYGAMLRNYDIELQPGLEAYAFGAVRQQLSAAQRLGKIGQTAVQTMLHGVKPYVEVAVRSSMNFSDDEIGGFAPVNDFAAMAHAHQAARMFVS